MRRLLPWLAAFGCAPELEPGTLGVARHFAELSGEVPMRLIPPQTDRQGNVYVLYGAPDWPDHAVYVGRPSGGWSGGCSAVRGAKGIFGFVGRTLDRMYYWAGDAIVRVDGNTGACREVLASDPVTNTELRFIGVVPRIDDTPSRRYLPALIRGGGRGQAFFVSMDLDLGRYLNPVVFEPADAEGVVVVGTGAAPAFREGWYVVTYQAGSTVTEAIRVDRRGDTILGRYALDEVLDEGAVQGFLQFSDAGLGAGLLSDGRILLLGEERGNLITVDGLEPRGIQARDGQLWVTGLSGGEPAIGRLTESGLLEDVGAWRSAIDAAAAVSGPFDVLDERSEPATNTTWDTPRSALGDHLLLSPWPLDIYTNDSTGWLVAGPSFDGTIEPRTSVAFVPVGVTLP
jgi:hypothetical protein